jgi:hypothetical protein
MVIIIIIIIIISYCWLFHISIYRKYYHCAR